MPSVSSHRYTANAIDDLGAAKTSTGSASPGTNSQLSNYNAAHTHTTNSQSVTENRPLFLTCKYLIRVD